MLVAAEEGGTRLWALLAPGDYLLRVFEPPRSVVISGCTSGNVAACIARALAEGIDMAAALFRAPKPDRLT